MARTIINLPGQDDFFTQEAFKVLRTNIQFCGSDIKTIVITSCNENEGKSTITLQLAKSLAELGKKVLVIDADMRKSVMAGRNTSTKDAVGLSEALTGMAALPDCIYSTQYKSFHLIFAGKYPPNPVELLNSKNFEALLEKSKEVFDYILIDTPPLGLVIDAVIVAQRCDGTIIVMNEQTVHVRQARTVISQLEKGGCKILGVVRNNVRKNNGGYYYKSKYKYSE